MNALYVTAYIWIMFGVFDGIASEVDRFAWAILLALLWPIVVALMVGRTIGRWIYR